MSPIATVSQVQLIQKVRNDLPGARDFFELTASRLRARRDLSFKRTIRVLREHGTVMTKDQLRDICMSLQKAGVGKLHSASNGKDFHFEVFYDLISIAKVALGEAKFLNPVPKPKLDLPELTALADVSVEPLPVSKAPSLARTAPKMVTVRYGAFEMDVPLTMDADEREQAAELIASLPQVKKD